MELTDQIRVGLSVYKKLYGFVRSVYCMTNNITIVKENKANHLNSKYYSSLQKDGLKGVYNRRYINERLPVDIAYNRVNNIPLSLILTDIDFFKKTKDKYGKISSDKILVDYSNLILKSIRSNVDWVGKLGREKFLIVLNGTNLKSAFCVAEKIRKQLESTTLKYDDISINITSSFGLYSVIDNNTEISVSELLSKVDNNLYQAKLRGRNRAFACQGILDEASSINNNGIKLSKLKSQISELRETLNEICGSTDKGESNPDRLIMSQYLDELIVEYMKETNNIH